MKLLNHYNKIEYSQDTIDASKTQLRGFIGLVFSKKAAKIAYLALFLAFMLFFSIQKISASPPDPHTITKSITSVNSYGSVHVDNDILIIARYNMAESLWYEHLLFQDGCTSQTPSTTIRCTFPGTLNSEIATFEFREQDEVTQLNPPIPNTPVQVRTIGDTMIGIYITGTSFTYETIADKKLCLVAKTPGTTNESAVCSAINVPNNPIEGGTVYQIISSHIVESFLSIEASTNIPAGTLINQTSNKVTAEGVKITRNISGRLQNEIPELFEFGTIALFATPTTPAAPGIEATLAAEATPTTVFHAAGEVGQAYFGMSPGLFINTMFFIMAIFAAFGGFALAQNGFGAAFGFVSVMAVTLFLNSSMMSYVLVLLVVLTIFTALWIVKKSPG